MMALINASELELLVDHQSTATGLEKELLHKFLEQYQERPTLVAQIPWVSNSPRKSLSLEQENSNTDSSLESSIKRKRVLLLLLDSLFPFYLPKRYHSMHCKGLAKLSPKCQFWYSAILHLVKSHFNGQGCHHLIIKQLETQTPDFSGFWKPWMQTLPVDAHNLDSEPDQCQSAGEFLLEPWVLLQLPFQHSLLHQWAIAVLAEALKLQKETISIFIIGVPRELWEEAQLLKKLIETLMQGALTLLSIFCNFANGAQQNICQRLRKVRTELIDTISRVTPIIEFILSDRCKNVISGIKRASWGSIHNQKEQNLLPMDIRDDFGLWRIWYNSSFWIDNEIPKYLFSDQKFPDINLILNLFGGCNLKIAYCKEDLDSFKEYVQEKIINKGTLVGASCQEIADVVSRAPSRLLQYQWSKNLKSHKEIGVLDENLSGVTYNIMNLHYELTTEREAAETARTLIYLLGTEEFGCKKVLYKEGCQKGYKFSASTNLKYTLNKVLDNKDWTYEKVLERTSNTLTNVVVEKQAPTLKFGAEKVAGMFQTRIENLVFNMLKQQFQTSASGSHPMLWYPECATVQYLLPCFVATFLDMHKDPSATQIQIKNCMLLVHELIYSYEQNPYVQNFTEQWKISYLYERRRTLYHEIYLSMSVFLMQVESKFKGTKILPVMIEVFKKFILIPQSLANHVDGDIMLYDWSVQMFMLTTRLQMCVQSLGWYNEPICTYFYHIWRGCGFTLSLGKDSLYDICWGSLKTQGRDKDTGLTKHQLLLIAIFVALKKSKRLGVAKFNLLQGPCFSLDLKSKVFFAVQTGDYWKLRQLMAPLLCDAGLVPVSEFCEANFCLLKEPYVCNEPLEGVKYVKMTQPGEDTMYPVKHCRWCGLLTADEVYRVCPLCLEYPEYNDTNHFCSEKCEKEALEKQHREEHARYFMVKLNMDSEMK